LERDSTLTNTIRGLCSTYPPSKQEHEVAEALGVGKNLVYAAIRAGRIPNVGLGRTVRIPTSWLVALLESWKSDDAAK
jgi:excisionase family DNA binding protein